MKILHIITSLYTGGAQIMLHKLLVNCDRRSIDATVVSLMGVSEVGEEIQSLGITVHSLDMDRGKLSLSKLLRLVHLIRCIKPDIIQTWMYHADLLGSLAALLAVAPAPVVWGIHHSNLDPRYNTPKTLKVAKLCSYLSHYMPAKIISCSQAAKETHSQFGYDKEKITVIPNGFDLKAFHPDVDARETVRQSIGVGPKTILIGMTARFDPQKDHNNFIQAAGILAREHQNTEFVLCGNRIDERNAVLMDWIRQAGIEQKMHLLGHRTDIPQILAALDIATLSSCGEAFPLALGEAMACGTPCVATDVGDSALIIGETGVIVPPQDAPSLAIGWSKLVDAGSEYRKKLGIEARERIQSKFSIACAAARYSEVYKELLYKPLAVQWPKE